jgi:hypothetical protein
MSRHGIAVAASAVIALTQPACQRHAASETVPGYAEKLAKKRAVEKARAATPETVTLDPPKFFSEEK